MRRQSRLSSLQHIRGSSTRDNAGHATCAACGKRPGMVAVGDFLPAVDVGVPGLPHALQFLDSNSPPDSIHFGGGVGARWLFVLEY
jgi:hypothetical protein